jgi:hypothetical protein
LIGETVQVIIHEATAFTLFGTVVTTERIHRPKFEDIAPLSSPEVQIAPSARVSLPVI